MIGDDWNGENFSWFSSQRALPPSLLDYEQTSPTLDNGGRILRSIVRPYPAKTAGIPLHFNYEMNSGKFTYEWVMPESGVSHALHAFDNASVGRPPLSDHPTLTSKETEVFYPSFLARGRKIIVTGLGNLDTYRYDETRQTLTVVVPNAQPGSVQRITVSLSPPLQAVFNVNTFWGDFGVHVGAIIVLLCALIVLWIPVW